MKKELYIPLIILALTLVFGAICLMVFLSDGNAYWIKKKLKIGALLLTFNGIVYGTNAQGVSCYLAPAPMPNHSLYGITFGASRINHQNTEINSEDKTVKANLYDATGTGYFIGLSYEYEIGNPYESLSSIICNVQYDNKPGKVNRYNISQTLNPIEEETIGFSKIKIDYSFSFITTEIFYKQNFFRRVPIGIIVGPYFSIPVKLNANETLYNRVNNIDSIKIAPEEKIIYNDEIKNAKAIDIGFIAGIQYEVIVGRDFKIIPSVIYKHSLTGIQYKSDWKITSMDFGISIRYRF